MKNPLKKEDHTGLIILGITAAVAAASLVYLYTTKNGADTRKAIKHKIKDEAKNLASGAISKKTGISKKTVKRVADFIAN